MEERVTLTLSLNSNETGDLAIAVKPPREPARFRVDRALLVVTIWHEGTDIIRGRVEHISSGTVAYFQGTDSLLSLGRVLNLRLTG